ncbi:MAG: hypothetical protein AAGB11_17990 [Pseudomonadota bacterium]
MAQPRGVEKRSTGAEWLAVKAITVVHASQRQERPPSRHPSRSVLLVGHQKATFFRSRHFFQARAAPDGSRAKNEASLEASGAARDDGSRRESFGTLRRDRA